MRWATSSALMGAMLCACGSGPVGNSSDSGATVDAVTADAAALPASCAVVPVAPPVELGLDPFYEKYVDVGGIPVVGSGIVRDGAFEPACDIMVHMLQLQYASGGAGHSATLTQLYDDARAAFLWVNTYAETNENEYWAEAVQSWFGVNRESDPPNGVHNHVDTREELQAYDPAVATFISQFFVAQDAP